MLAFTKFFFVFSLLFNFKLDGKASNPELKRVRRRSARLSATNTMWVWPGLREFHFPVTSLHIGGGKEDSTPELRHALLCRP